MRKFAVYLSILLLTPVFIVLSGSFAAFPLFLVWMQLSRLVVLMGAEIYFANQNVNRYEFGYEPTHK
ncbi:MAG TPA: hypothetical protein ENH59_03490 [Bacteroidetes bacterium]|nr:hypothetical protein [Bacteroidota bacterium]